ncbi:hypothetical protein GCM10022415_29740 [Knoellia locipacati]|uniref:Uncharacterized protein n=1 Tax=Knoellia locipacati TaxID=882824 RepID=A0A512T4X5_9MICO|nr:hypothetical protein [Knoellia locipacati]GEQ15213.1 hypothetical protein KLO01_32600 [Knoellia locipacati]
MSEHPTHNPQQPQQGQWHPAYPPAPPVKQRNWFMRHKIITGILGLVVVGTIAGALGGGGDTPSTATAEPTSAASPAAGGASSSPAAAPAAPKVDPDDVGNEANPVTIVEGKAFDIRKFTYGAGWKITSNDFGMEVTNLKVTNNRDDRDGAIVEIKFMNGSEVLASVDCTSDQILPGQTVTLSCISGDKKPKGYDRITINDMS